MSQTLITAGQSLIDVAIQELGSVEALFDLADANGMAITDVLTPGHTLTVPASPSTVTDIVSYFQQRNYRINTGAPLPPLIIRRRDFNPFDFKPLDFN